MTRDEIFRLALEVGLVDPDLCGNGQLVTDYGDATAAVMHFAALVAADERAAVLAIQQTVLLAAAEEAQRLREALEALVWDVENKAGDPHTLRHARDALR